MSAQTCSAEPADDIAGSTFSENAGYSVYIVLLFFICFAFSYLDRQVVSILVPPIKQSLGLTDTQIGLLQGFSFTMCYATAGVFVARLVDRANRVKLIAACIAIWAISTAACGFASNFSELLLARAGTAIAESASSAASKERITRDPGFSARHPRLRSDPRTRRSLRPHRGAA